MLIPRGFIGNYGYMVAAATLLYLVATAAAWMFEGGCWPKEGGE